MPPEVYIVCPKCEHEYNIHKRVYDRGPNFAMFCPLCNAEFPRQEARIAGANVPIDSGGDKS
jgi:hypothetical protein